MLSSFLFNEDLKFNSLNKMQFYYNLKIIKNFNKKNFKIVSKKNQQNLK